MSKYQPRIFINDPEKNVPNDIVEQFFLTIKTGDIDKIREFTIQNKNKYNLIEKGTKENQSGKSPVHIVLELDDKIADEDTKLQIIKFLDKMGAAFDIPDALNIWPIHLATGKQYESIVDFLVKKQVSLNRKDSSNNTPLHYSINGKEISCPKSVSVKSLVPEQKFDKLPLNKSLENINKKLINLLNSNDELNANIMHMINTIMKIPEMYVNNKLQNNLQTEIVDIFVETAITPTYPSDIPSDITTIVPKTAGMTSQQTKIEQLINRYYSLVNDELLQGLINAMDISANNSGWGPETPIDAVGGVRPPNDIERIMKDTTDNMMKNILNDYVNLKNSITTGSTITDSLVQTSIPNIVNNIDKKFIEPLIFCSECSTINYGEMVTLTKMFLLMSYNFEKINYSYSFATKILKNFKLMNKPLYDQIMDNPNQLQYYLNGEPIPYWRYNDPGILFMNSICDRDYYDGNVPIHRIGMIKDSAFDSVRTDIDIVLDNVAYMYTKPVPPPAKHAINIDCMNNQLRILFTNSDERPITGIPNNMYPHSEYLNGILGKKTFEQLFNDMDFENYSESFNMLRPQYKNRTWTWFNMMSALIEEINPIPKPSNIWINYAREYFEREIFVNDPYFDMGRLQLLADRELAEAFANLDIRTNNRLEKYLNDKDDIRKTINNVIKMSTSPRRRNQPPIYIQREANNFMANDIFGSELIPNTNLPQTPFANSNNRTRRGGLIGYTYFEMFRLLNAIESYLVNNDFQITNYPQIFDYNIRQWDDYIDVIANTPLGILIPNLVSNPTIGEYYPEFIFLYRIFITRVLQNIRNIIEKCVKEIFDRASEDNSSTDLDIVSLRNFVKPINDAHALYMLLPSEPDVSKFTINDNDPLADLKANKWLNMEKIMIAFAHIKDKYIDDDVWNNIVNNINFFPMTTYFTYEKMPQLRQLIEESVPELQKSINPIIIKNDFRNTIRQYLGTYRSNKERIPRDFELNIDGRIIKIPNRRIIDRYKIVTRKIDLFDVFDQTIFKLKELPSTTTEIFYLTELYGHTFVKIQQLLLKIQEDVFIINKIIADIIVFINGQIYYYIPQIFLPALIKQVLVVVMRLFDTRNYLSVFNNRKAILTPLINISDEYANNIIGLGNEFNTYVNGELNVTYKKLIDIIKYHNDIIDFLNFTSAVQLMKSEKYPLPSNVLNYRTTKIFTMNLIPVEAFPNIFMDIPNFESILPIIRSYKIPNIMYYDQVIGQPYFDVFGIRGNPDVGDYYTIDMYRNVIEYQRSPITDNNKLSNSPQIGANTQLNIRAINTAVGPDYRIRQINTNYDGEWLDVQMNNQEAVYDPSVIKFSEAFIAYINRRYNFDWLNGMPPSIKMSVGPYLKIIKQKVIEETIQFIINNKHTDADQDPELVKIYEDIRRLGNESTYTNIDDVKIHIVIGKLLDSIINKLLEYSIRQSISSWILGSITSDNNFRNLADTVNKNINIIRQKDYLKLTLNEIDEDAINDLLSSGSKFVDTSIIQIEPKLDDIKYVSKSSNKNFVNYLYNINYVSMSGNIGLNNKCYKINPMIVSKLITSNTVNSKNSDGDTPLHMAVNMTNPELVNLLIMRGANPKSYVNIQGKTPRDLGFDYIKQHMEFTIGSDVISTIKNFVEPFNDMLISRIKDDKYGNNIIKNITMGIPIQLIMYNHMFHLYLENYRHNFTIDIKNKIKALIQKYIGNSDVIYPIDLLTINDRSELAEILKPEMSKNRVYTVINEKNIKKSANYKKELFELKNQLDGYNKEISTVVDSNQVEFINKIRTQIQYKIDSIEAKITALEVNNSPENEETMSVYLTAYQSTVKSIPDRIERTTGLIDFYNFSFGRIGKTKQLYLNVWENYFNKKLPNAPSMIFSLLSDIIERLVLQANQQLFDSEKAEELQTIVEFYSTVQKYIESKNPVGNLDDDLLLAEEINQIIYLINLIITPSVRNILLNQIYLALKEMDGANSIVRDQNAILEEILTVEFNGQTLDSYLTTILPLSAIKYYAMIYNNSYDVDRKNVSDVDLFLPIIQIIKSNKIIQITDDSLLIQNLRDYLIPFLSNTYQNFIHHLRLSIYAYEKYLLNTYQLTKIMEQLI